MSQSFPSSSLTRKSGHWLVSRNLCIFSPPEVDSVSSSQNRWTGILLAAQRVGKFSICNSFETTHEYDCNVVHVHFKLISCANPLINQILGSSFSWSYATTLCRHSVLMEIYTDIVDNEISHSSYWRLAKR